MAENNKQIEINVMRVSSNGEYIEFIISAPEEYLFTTFNIIIDNGTDSPDVYSVAESVFYDEDGNYIINDNNLFSGLIPLSAFGAIVPRIYEIELEAEVECVSCDPDEQQESLKSHLYISDVNNVYNCLIDDIISFDANCDNFEVQNRAIRNYLLLYAHQEALHLGYLDEAKQWFKKLSNCFSNCGDKPNRDFNINCGCGGSCRPAPPVRSHGCGCGK